MKKQILVLSLCLAMTSASALAAPLTNMSTSTPSIGVSGLPVPAEFAKSGKPSAKITSEQTKNYIEGKRAKERAFLYSALNLTDDQKAKATAIDAKTKAEIDPLMKNLHKEIKKLRDLKTKNANIFAIWKQQYTVNSAKTNVKSRFIKSKRDFEAILTKEQKATYNKIQADRQKKMQEFRKTNKAGSPKGMGPKSKGLGPNHMGPPPEDMGIVGPKGLMGPPPPPPPANK